MTKATKTERALQAQQKAKVRGVVTKELERMERLYGEQAVGGAYEKHRQIRRERRRLLRAQAEIKAKIAKLRE